MASEEPPQHSGGGSDGGLRVSVIGINGREVLGPVAIDPEGTVQDLQKRVHEAGGVSPAKQRLVLRDSVLPPRSSLRSLGVDDGAQLTLVISSAIVEYRVVQGHIIKKLGDDPEAANIRKFRRPVGSRVATTGRTWRGPGGGEWVEADPSVVKPGWYLVRGLISGSRAPMLVPEAEEVEGVREEPLMLSARHPLDEDVFFDLCLWPSQTVAQAKQWVAWRVPGLVAHKIVVVQERFNDPERSYRPSDSPSQSVFSDDRLLRDTGLRDGDELKYIYMGDIDVDLGEEAKESLASLMPREWSSLTPA